MMRRSSRSELDVLKFCKRHNRRAAVRALERKVALAEVVKQGLALINAQVITKHNGASARARVQKPCDDWRAKRR